MENKFLYRSSLKSKDIPRFQMMGITSELILSKQVFSKNFEITLFLTEVFNVEFKNYVMKSRTMILSRTVRIIEKCSENEYQDYRRKLLNFVEEQYNSEEVLKSISKSSISKWVTGD